MLALLVAGVVFCVTLGASLGGGVGYIIEELLKQWRPRSKTYRTVSLRCQRINRHVGKW
jgi:membrane protein YqaA with SNARE-associated domain